MYTSQRRLRDVITAAGHPLGGAPHLNVPGRGARSMHGTQSEPLTLQAQSGPRMLHPWDAVVPGRRRPRHGPTCHGAAPAVQPPSCCIKGGCTPVLAPGSSIEGCVCRQGCIQNRLSVAMTVDPGGKQRCPGGVGTTSKQRAWCQVQNRRAVPERLARPAVGCGTSRDRSGNCFDTSSPWCWWGHVQIDME